MRRPLLFLALAGLLLASYGPYLNDENDQASAMWSLLHGSLKVDEYPDEYYIVYEHLSINQRYEQSDLPVGSTLLTFLAFPIAAALWGADAIAPLSFWFAATVLVLGWIALGAGAPWQGTRTERTIRTATALGGVAFLTSGFRATSPDLDLYLAMLALQVTNLLLWFAGAALLLRLLEARVAERRVVLPVWVAAVVGPWMFWGDALKYHALTAFLVVALLHLRGRMSGWRAVAYGACVALSVWASPGFGLAVVAAVSIDAAIAGVSAFWRRAATARQTANLAGLGALGAAIILVPWALVNLHLTENPLSPPEFGAVPNDPGTPGATGTIADRLIGLAANSIQWRGWQSHLLHFGSILTTGHLVEAAPMGVLLASPLLLGALLAWRARHSLEGRFALSLALAFFAVLTMPASAQGGGYDVRMFVPLVPALAVLAAHNLRPFLEAAFVSPPRWWHVSVASVVTAFLLLTLLVQVARFELGPTNVQHVRVFLWAWLGVSALAAGFVLALSMLRPQWDAWVPAATVGLAVAIPVIWTVLFMFAAHTSLPTVDGHEGGSFLVPRMQTFAEGFRALIVHDPPLPRVFDGAGNLVFHPDYGLCTREPSPCPTEVREQLFRGTIDFAVQRP